MLWTTSSAKAVAPDVPSKGESVQGLKIAAPLSVGANIALEDCAGGFRLAPGQVHPWHMPAMPSQEKLRASPTYPVFVSPNPMTTTQVINGSRDPKAEVPVNQGPFTISSSLFEGIMEIHLKGLRNTRKQVFDGKKRFFQIMLQGRFKRPVPAADLMMGQEFVKASQAPPWVAEIVFTAAAKAMSNSTQVEGHGTLPYFFNPLVASCQLMNVSRPGQAPTMDQAHEDMRLFSSALADKNNKPVSAAKRKKWCDVPRNLEGITFDTDNIYTVHIWQHFVDFANYKLSLGGLLNMDLAPGLNGQPLQLTICDRKAKESLASMLVWHERLLYDDNPEARAANQVLTERLTRLGSGLFGLLGRK